MLSRTLCVGVVLLACCQPIHGETIVVRDTIGCGANGNNCTSTLTDGMPGATAVFGTDGGGPDLIIAPGSRFTPGDSGLLEEAKFVIFVSGTGGIPENDPTFFDTFHLTFNLWTDGVQGGPDSFAVDPAGDLGGNHERHIVNDAIGGPDFSSLEVFGQTGPPGDPSLFTTYLVTVDLSSFGIAIEANREYVFNIIEDIDKAPSNEKELRLVGSTVEDGSEDVWFTTGTPTITPGFVQSQQGAAFQLFGTYLSMENGDHDGNNVVDGFDFLKWQRGESPQPLSSFDLAAWELNFGETLIPTVVASVTTPEPSTVALVSMSVTLLSMQRRRRCSCEKISK